MATYYVDSVNGLDSFVGSEAQPWQTLPGALGKVVSGDTIILEDGDYTAGTSTAKIVNRRFDTPITVRTRHRRQVRVNQAFFQACRGITFEGIDFRLVPFTPPADTDNTARNLQGGVRHFHFIDCDFPGGAFFMAGTADVSFDSCEIHDTKRDYIGCTGGSNGDARGFQLPGSGGVAGTPPGNFRVQFRRCRMANFFDDAFQIGGPCNDILVEECDISNVRPVVGNPCDDHADCFQIFGAKDVEIRRCVIRDTLFPAQQGAVGQNHRVYYHNNLVIIPDDGAAFYQHAVEGLWVVNNTFLGTYASYDTIVLNPDARPFFNVYVKNNVAKSISVTVPEAGVSNNAVGIGTASGPKIDVLMPDRPRCDVVGTDTTTPREYAIVAENAAGKRSAAYSTVRNGPATLSATNYFNLMWGAVNGAVAYHVLRKDDGVWKRLNTVATNGTGTTPFKDDGSLTPVAFAPPVGNEVLDFVNESAGDYRPKATSPLIGAGVTGFLGGWKIPEYDRLGKSRAGRNDLGCHQGP